MYLSVTASIAVIFYLLNNALFETPVHISTLIKFSNQTILNNSNLHTLAKLVNENLLLIVK